MREQAPAPLDERDAALLNLLTLLNVASTGLVDAIADRWAGPVHYAGMAIAYRQVADRLDQRGAQQFEYGQPPRHNDGTRSTTAAHKALADVIAATTGQTDDSPPRPSSIILPPGVTVPATNEMATTT